jgi:hypothetical protein
MMERQGGQNGRIFNKHFVFNFSNSWATVFQGKSLVVGNFGKKPCRASFWASFSQTHLVTLMET